MRALFHFSVLENGLSKCFLSLVRLVCVVVTMKESKIVVFLLMISIPNDISARFHFGYSCLWGGGLSAPSLDNLIQFVIEAPLTFNLCFYPCLSLLQVGWFLGMIFTFYIIFPFFVFMIWTKKRAWLVLMITLFLSLISTYYYKHTEGWSTFQTVGVSIIVFSPRFVVGGLLFLYKDKIAKTLKSISEQRCSLIRGIMVVLIAVSFYAMTYESFVLNAFNILFVLYAISFSKYPLLDNKVTNVLSDLSFEIYLSHMLIFRVLERLHLTHCIENYTLNYIFVLTIVFIGSFLFSYVVKYYVLPTLMKVPTLIIRENK